MSESAARWKALDNVLTSLERAFEASCRMDVKEQAAHVYAGRGRRSLGPSEKAILQFERRMDALVNTLDKVIDRMTVQRILRDQVERERRDAAELAARQARKAQAAA